MAKTDFKSVAEYLAKLPKQARTALGRVRATLRKALPDADEVISYQIPALKLHGSAVIYFAAWKAHYSLYPATQQVVSSFKQELAQYELSKGTIRFPLSEPVPSTLIAAIAQVRARETLTLLAERAAKRSKVSQKTNASSKKTNASSKKTNASSKKTNASSKKTNASSKKTKASSKKTNASRKKTNAS